MERTVRYPDGRDWSKVRAKIMFKEYNEVMAMDIIKRIPNWPKNTQGWKGFAQMHKFLQWIVAVYDPESPLQREFIGRMNEKRREAAIVVGFEQDKKGVWKPDVYHEIIESKIPIDDLEEENEETETTSEMKLFRKMMKTITAYVIWASNHRWQNLCAYENYYVELQYAINKPLRADKDKDLMGAAQIKDKLVDSLNKTSKLIQETWDTIIQEDRELKVYIEKTMPVKPENQ